MQGSHRAKHESYQLMGINHTVMLDFLPPAPRRRHVPIVAPWTQPILEGAAAFGRSIDCLTSDGSVEAASISPADLWGGPQSFLVRRGATVITDQEWLAGKADGQGPVAVIVIDDFPPDLAGMANGVEAVCFAANLQLGDAKAKETGNLAIIETDCKSIISRGDKEYSRYGKRSLDNRQHGYLYRFIRRIKRTWPGGTQRWVRSHPERRSGIGAFTSSEARISLADAFAGNADPEVVLSNLTTPRVSNCKFHLIPSQIHRVSAKEILEGIFSPGDFCWIDENGFPLTASLLATGKDDIGNYLSAREGYAKSGSGYPWKDTEVGLLGHLWEKTRKLRTHAERKEQVQNIWDKHMHGRNKQKHLKLATPPACPLCEIAVDSQAHYALRCSHPYFSCAREGFERQILERIQQLPTGVGKTTIWNLWQWVFYPEANSCSEKEEMARMGLIVGRPLKESLKRGEGDQRIGKKDRPALLECLMDLWITAETYLHQLWKLRGSVIAAPGEVQRTMRTHAASPLDVQGLIRNPYYSKSQQRKQAHWMSSLAKFCQHHRHLAPIEEQKETEEPVAQETSTSKWDPEWTRWLTRHSAFGKPPKKPKAPKVKKRRRTNSRRQQKTSSQDEPQSSHSG